MIYYLCGGTLAAGIVFTLWAICAIGSRMDERMERAADEIRRHG
jgi:hypothetical protein